MYDVPENLLSVGNGKLPAVYLVADHLPDESKRQRALVYWPHVFSHSFVSFEREVSMDRDSGGNPEKDEKGRFLPGNSGNGGRPKGSRNKLGEQFLADLHADWEAHGKVALEKTRETKPEVYVKVVASILPRELNVRVNELDELSDEQIARQLASVASQLARAGFDLGAGAGEAEAPQSFGGVSSLH